MVSSRVRPSPAAVFLAERTNELITKAGSCWASWWRRRLRVSDSRSRVSLITARTGPSSRSGDARTRSAVAAAAAALLVLASPLLLEGPVRAVIRLTRDRESLTLNLRRHQLAQHEPAFVMSSFVRSAKKTAAGEGRTLLDTMKTEWQSQHAAVIFYPANNALLRYYADEGAVLDLGANCLMQINYQRPAEQNPT